MEWYPKESVRDPLRDQPNNGERPVEKSMSAAGAEMSNSKSSPCGGASKRKRVYHKSPERVKCSVDGCNFDLRNCTEYHRRHRVCQPHSKTPLVLVKGQEQRFCQQCSRFQSLDEFDGFKRSCRRRLEGHNKRRRKSRPPPIGFSAHYRGPRMLKFGNPTANDPYAKMWSAQHGSYHNRYPPILPKIEIEQQSVEGRAFANTGKMKEKQVISGDWHNNHTVAPEEAGMGSSRSQKMMPWDSALYLLSAQSSPEFSMVESSIECPIQSQPPWEERVQLEDDDGTPNCSCSRSVTSGPRLGLDGNATNFDHNGMLQMEPQVIGNDGGSATLPFFWE